MKPSSPSLRDDLVRERLRRGPAPRRRGRPPARRTRARCAGSTRGRARGRSPCAQTYRMIVRSSNDRSVFAVPCRPWPPRPSTPALRERYDRRREEVVAIAARTVRRARLPRDLDAGPRRGDRADGGRALPLHREQGPAARAHLRPADGAAAGARRGDRGRARRRPTSSCARSCAPGRRTSRTTATTCASSSRSATCSSAASSGATCAASARRSRRSSRAAASAASATGRCASPTAAWRCARCWAWSTTRSQWFRPRGRLTAEQVADGYLELLGSGRRAAGGGGRAATRPDPT